MKSRSITIDHADLRSAVYRIEWLVPPGSEVEERCEAADSKDDLFAIRRPLWAQNQ